MVGMFVRDDDAVEIDGADRSTLGGLLQRREPAQSFTLAESGVNEETGPRGLEQGAIARTA